MSSDRAVEAGGPPTAEMNRDTSLLRVANVLLAARWPIAFTAAFAAVLTASIALLLPRTYTAEATFMPEAPRSLNLSGAATGLLSSFGVSLPTSEPTQSPAFYVDLLSSREILAAAVDTVFPAPAPSAGQPVSLEDWFHATGRTPGLRRDDAIRRLRDHIKAEADPRVGLVRLQVETPSAELSMQLARFLVHDVDQFNLEKRQSQAGMERQFVEARLNDVRGQLRGAEDSLQSFLQHNRDYKTSPELTFQEQRLSERVNLLQQLFTSLTQSYEQVRIEEVRDTPLITMIESPAAPLRPDSRGLLAKLVAALVLGAAAAAGIAFARAALRGNGASSADATEFARLRGEAWNDLRHPVRGLRRAIRR